VKATILGAGWVTTSGWGRGSDTTAFSLVDGELPRLRRSDIFAEPLNRFGRLDDFSRLGLTGIALALQDAGLDQWQEKRPIGVMASTRYGCLATDLAYFETVIPDGGALASPHLFAYTLASSFIGEAAICLGLTGPGFVVNDDVTGRMGGLRCALESLAWEECQIVVAGFCDLSAPLSLNEQGAQIAPPGAVFLVLENVSKSAPGRGVKMVVTRDGTISLGDVSTTDWATLVQAYLTLRSPLIVENRL